MFVNEKYLNFSSSVSYDRHSIIWLGDSECWYSRLKGEINKFIHNPKMKQAHSQGLRMENLLTKETLISEAMVSVCSVKNKNIIQLSPEGEVS